MLIDTFISCVSSAERVYSFPVFTPDFCRRLLEELDNFLSSNLPVGKPNTMNKYGVSHAQCTSWIRGKYVLDRTTGYPKMISFQSVIFLSILEIQQNQ